MIKPMLAHNVNAKPVNWEQKVFMQPKLDGVRCLIKYEKTDYGHNTQVGEVKAYSRTGKEWKNIEHILENLKPFFDKNPNMTLDGELYNHDLRDDFEKIISLVRKTKPTPEDRLEAKSLVQFHCYDFINELDTYEFRMSYLLCSDIYSYCVHYTPTERCLSEEHARILHAANIVEGYEGSILRLDKPYECKRSYSLQKFKDFSDKEATIVSYVEGKGKRLGTLGKFLMIDDDGIEFGCPPGKGYNYKDLANILQNINNYIGKRATFTYFGRTKAMSYRHPMYKTLRNYE